MFLVALYLSESWCTMSVCIVCKYVDQNNSASMLATKRLAGVASEVNLNIALHAGDKAHKREDLTWL